jgi:conjugative transfer region protein (TIGR03748 family)
MLLTGTLTMKSFAAPVFVLLAAFSAHAHSGSGVRVSRYATIDPVATAEQTHPLSVVVTVEFNDRIHTVGEAIDFLLLRSGYRIADYSHSDPALPILLQLPLPLVHRKLGPIPLDQALRTLAGEAWDLVVDPVNRLISFELLERYRASESVDG